MMKQVLSRLKQYIIDNNNYFNVGYDDVYKNSQGIVNESGVIFPMDIMGNYFYLRLPDSVSLRPDSRYAVSECITGLGGAVNIVLVALVRSADEDKLLTNLLNTLQSFSAEGKDFTSATYNRHVVIAEELSTLKPEVIAKALQNLPDDLSIVSINFSITQGLPFNKCIVNPCRTC